MTRVDLRWNQLTVFEQGVFKNILQQMMKAQQPQKGYVNLTGSILFNTFVYNIMKYFIGLF